MDVAQARAEEWHYLRYADDMVPEVAEHLIRRSGDPVTGNALGLAKEEKGSAFFGCIHGVYVAPRELIDWGVGEDHAEFELSDGAAEHAEIDLASVSCHFGWEHSLEEVHVSGIGVQAVGQQEFPDWVVESEECGRGVGIKNGGRQRIALPVVEDPETRVHPPQPAGGIELPRGAGVARDLGQLRRRHLALCRGEVRDARIVRRELRRAFRRRKDESHRRVERVSRRGCKPPVPHELRVKDRVHHGWSTALIPRSLSLRTDDVVVLNTDGHGL